MYCRFIIALLLFTTNVFFCMELCSFQENTTTVGVSTGTQLELLEKADFMNKSLLKPFKDQGYVFFPEKKGPYENPYILLVGNAAFLQRVVRDEHPLLPHTKKMLCRLFKHIHLWDKVRDDEIKKLEEVRLVKGNGIYFRYPSYEKIVELFGKQVANDVQKKAKQWCLEDFFWKKVRECSYQEMGSDDFLNSCCNPKYSFEYTKWDRKLFLLNVLSDACGQQDEGVENATTQHMNELKKLIHKIENPANEALHRAAKKGSIEKCLVLIGEGIDVNGIDKFKNTSLHYAKSDEVAQLLINSGADVEARNSCGETPLMTQLERPGIVRILLSAGANANAINKYGNSVLEEAVSEECQACVLDDLVEAGADLARKDAKGRSVIERIDSSKGTLLSTLEKYGYYSFTSRFGPMHDLHYSLKDNAAYLKKCIADDCIYFAKKQLYRLFKAIYVWDDIRNRDEKRLSRKSNIGIKSTEKVVDHELVKYINNQGLYFRYPSYDLLVEMFGQAATDYAVSVTKKWLLGDFLFNIIGWYGHEASENVCKGKSVIDPNEVLFWNHSSHSSTSDIKNCLRDYKSEECKPALLEKLRYNFFTLQSSKKELQVLIERGLDVHSKNPAGETILTYAANKDCYIERIEELLHEIKNIDPHATNDKGQTPLFLAICYCNDKFVDLLLRYGAQVSTAELEKAQERLLSGKKALIYDREERIFMLIKNAYEKQQKKLQR